MRKRLKARWCSAYPDFAFGWTVSFETLQAGVAVLEKEKMKPNFGNGGAINNLLSKATTCYEQRLKRERRSAAERAADAPLARGATHAARSD